MINKWDKRFLLLAEHISKWSKDPSTQVGAVLVNDQRVVVGMGFNGFPRNIYDDPEIYQDRGEKYKYIVHAEMNAIANASGSINGTTVYTWPFMPCSDCAKHLIQFGIQRVVSIKETQEQYQRWRDSFSLTMKLFNESNTKVVTATMEELYV